MNKLKKNESGFGTTELILVVVVIVLLTAVGYLVYKNQKKVTPVSTKTATVEKTSAPATVQPADQYAGWKQYTTKYQKVSIKYPSDWKLTDNTGTQGAGSDASTVGTANQDLVTFTSPNGALLTFQSVVPKGAASSDTPLVSSDAVTFAGQKDYLLYYSSSPTDKSGPVGAAHLSTSATSLLLPSTKSSSDTKWNVSMTPGAPIAATALASNQDFKNAKLIIGSATY